MVFSSLVFLCVFFPLVFIFYSIIPGLKGKNILLIIASLVFYAYGEPVYIILMLFSICMNYIFGLLCGPDKRGRKAAVIVSVILNLGMLGVFKYSGFFVESINNIFGLHLNVPDIKLPVGISFFTFQALSYVIDVYRQDVAPQKNFAKILLYISFFPQLIAGPIIKYHDIEKQIGNREQTALKTAMGLRRFIIGLSKKVLIANTMALTADNIFALGAYDINILTAWAAALAYMMQIYYDFSGYSDMAIGLGQMFGFEFRENFNYPYSALSIRDFWRKWHISLSTWFKEYLYIPLGGNRKGKARTCINKLIVFFCTGFWHGANWTFIIWGLYNGFFMLLEEFIPKLKAPKILKHVYAILVVCVGFVIFRADTITQGVSMIGKMFSGFEFSADAMSAFLAQLTPLFIITLAAACVLSFPVKNFIINRLINSGRTASIVNGITYVLSPCLLIICMLSLAGGTYNPFIYFRF